MNRRELLITKIYYQKVITKKLLNNFSAQHTFWLQKKTRRDLLQV